ncbi:hypothetical protein PFICI_11718 [Pestalotiopsis fici W106-1]|uniref:Uncharacterized protein n=1 Tax=Pestalotiopsis fici (strain W106-1 / CGMCC3.15140) TaxID=1229662 RepID=W3WU17_PESFW|nr:uncharacterized protein PFICI_11718 [Pestalotiopsis fici W106-1]ETS76331.1 hypothetical protein PFICI_11718 [Pestalotiopsis fici W106-1]
MPNQAESSPKKGSKGSRRHPKKSKARNPSSTAVEHSSTSERLANEDNSDVTEPASGYNTFHDETETRSDQDYFLLYMGSQFDGDEQ